MGRKVVNEYKITEDVTCTALKVLSFNYYEVVVKVDSVYVPELKKYSWCFDQGKGLVYMTDLTMELPNKLGYKTARLYLREFILYLAGKWDACNRNVVWHRNDIFNYRLRNEDVKPLRS